MKLYYFLFGVNARNKKPRRAIIIHFRRNFGMSYIIINSFYVWFEI